MVPESFTFRRVGTMGCEIVNPDGEIVAWTVDPAWAAIIVALLDMVEQKGLHESATCLKPPADDGQQHLSP